MRLSTKPGTATFGSHRSRSSSRWLLWSALAAASLNGLTGCATVQQPDPQEAMNRKVFSLNGGLDKAVVKPVATTYENDTPAPVRRAVSNFFGNIEDGWSSINALLQGRVADSVEDLGRLASNSTLGVLELADVATDMGPKNAPG